MKVQKIIYWIATGLLTLLMLFSAGMYFLNNEEVRGVFEQLGYPTYVIYPLAILKISGLVVILSNKWKLLKEWAYAGFFFNFLLAFSAHRNIQDGDEMGAAMGLVFLLGSYFLGKKVRP